ncbi:MAG: tetratricopeptide repeat protein [Propionibacterium sp.]|jgi:putative thioredoxin|uniref:Tetratricopeptide repeat protein n=1 Tax=Brooklawnia propionicigenes TaxID=3041175 RepID=A0AAN0MIE0_9ACTN|nr:tetratricopeptide repeat protein [Brooklawnia sp. SH051]NLI85288.1 tetratricopeptide repeat protein [Propionibacterium sp.]BEH03523.1 tetratricopeptide repeat protein [Brooklawnia sp. SH051]
MNADQSFSRPGAIDLSSLTASAATQPPASAGGSYVLEVTEAVFEQVAQQSMQYPVILVFVSGGDRSSQQVATDLAELVNGLGGRMVLGVVDVAAQARIAQALGVQAVPTAVALIGGQLAPLFQGTRDKADIKALLDQVAQIAVANGLTGRAQPQAAAPAPEQTNGEPAVDPRFAAADEALQAGDFAKAVQEFDKLLKANPRDSEAQAGRAQASLLLRTAEVDPAAIAKADAAPDDIDLQLAAADLELVTGHAEQAFTRLVNLVRRTSGDEREQVRVRLVELFETADPADPAVTKARRALSMALF